MKKNLLLSVLVGIASMTYAAEPAIITATPVGTLYSEVYGTSANTYLIAQGGLGSFADNDGYRTKIVINGKDIYIHNIIREYAGIDSWVKGTIGDDGVAEFVFPQPVAKNAKGEMLYAAMMKPVGSTGNISLVADTENPCLRMSWDGTKLTQLITPTDTPRFDGMIGLANENGIFQSYGERNVTYTIWKDSPAVPGNGLETTPYTASYSNEWNESFTTRVELGIDGETAWLKGIASVLPQAWIKGNVNADGSITFASEQYLGIYSDYFIFFYGAEDKSTPAGKVYEWLDNVTITKNGEEWQAGSEMIINLGKSHPWFGAGIANLKLTPIASLDPVPAAPEWGEPEWDENDGMGVGDFMIPSVDINGQALETDKLYYRLFYNGELAPGDELRQFGKDYDDIMYIGDGWHFALFLEPLNSIGVQSVYKDGGKEYTSEVITYTFENGGVGNITVSNAEAVSTEYYNLTGTRLNEPEGLCIRRTTYADGKVKAEKIIVK